MINLMTQKGLAPILIVILIAAATFGYLIYSGKINVNQIKPSPAYRSPDGTTMSKNQNDETVNWKTFESPTFGFSYKYPNDWVNDNMCQGCTAQPVNEKSNERYLHPEQVKYPEGITYIIDSKKGSISVDAYRKLEQGYPGNRKISDISIDGYIGIRIKGTTLDGETIDSVIFENKNYIFQISANKGYSGILDSIVSTVKFQ